MARIRSIKPEFWKSEEIAQLPHRTRLTFIALWSYVDDNGVGRDVPQLIAGELFALEPDPRETLANVREDLARLSDHQRITRYTVAGKPFLYVNNWDKHQRIDKPNKPRYERPDHPEAVLTCGYGGSREGLAQVSREMLASPAPGAVEQGNRGTGDVKTPSPLRDEALSGFAEFWRLYPRKVGKQAALKAYRKALKTATVSAIVEGVGRYAADPNLPEPTFIPHPATWLNGGHWDDEALPARNVRALPTRVSEQDDTLRRWMTEAQQGQLPELGA